MYGTPPIDASGHASLAGDRAPTPLFGDDTQSFVQQMRFAAQAHRAGRLDEAIGSYLRLLSVQPHHAELHNNLGVALRLAGKLEASVCHHRLSLAAEPDNPALHSNLGNALRAANRLDEAATHHFRSISLNRTYAEGFFNLALCLRDLGRVEESVGCFTRSLSLEPDNVRVKAEHAIALLMRGEMEAGFAAYEVRKQLADWPKPDFTKPPWLGGPIAGRRILLYPEQGLSDVLLFVRFARELKRRGAFVIVLCQALLKDLLASADYIDEVVAEGELLPPFDVHASLVSLPHLCRVDFEAVPTEPAYLQAPTTSRIKLGHVEGEAARRGLLGGDARAGAGPPSLRAVQRDHGAGERSRAAGVQPAGRRGAEGDRAARCRRPGARCRPRHLRLRRGGDGPVATRHADLDRRADCPSRSGDEGQDLGPAAASRRLALAPAQPQRLVASDRPPVRPAARRRLGRRFRLTAPRAYGTQAAGRGCLTAALSPGVPGDLSRSTRQIDILELRVSNRHPARLATRGWRRRLAWRVGIASRSRRSGSSKWFPP